MDPFTLNVLTIIRNIPTEFYQYDANGDLICSRNQRDKVKDWMKIFVSNGITVFQILQSTSISFQHGCRISERVVGL